MILNIFKGLFMTGNYIPSHMTEVILTTACIVYSFSHFTFLFPSPICVFIGVIPHSELTTASIKAFLWNF